MNPIKVEPPIKEFYIPISGTTPTTAKQIPFVNNNMVQKVLVSFRGCEGVIKLGEDNSTQADATVTGGARPDGNFSLDDGQVYNLDISKNKNGWVSGCGIDADQEGFLVIQLT